MAEYDKEIEWRGLEVGHWRRRTDHFFILDAGGNPQPEFDIAKWGAWFETADRKIARTEIGDVAISTVFLGLDHGFGSGRPVLFETMVFGGPLDQEQERYSTKSEAIAGHEAMAARVRAKLR